MMREDLKEKILKHSIPLASYGINGFAWKRENALNLIESLMEEEIGILGGDVYRITSNRLIPVYENWWCDPIDGDTNKEFFLRSKKMALEYIESYPENQDIFSIVFTNTIN